MPVDPPGGGAGCGAEPRNNPGRTRIVIPAEPEAVREGLRALFDTLLLRALPEAERGTAEIVLAEALNNIVEHAYARDSGKIELTLQLHQSELVCLIEDQGLAMPRHALPTGELPEITGPDALPEGGFGWHLIRSLSRDLHYRRIGGRNQLSFRLDAGQSGG
ncbi:MAG: ATP-binding protein [Pseudorhodobacter sp.]|nr:ATP-binding protein [Pseudorhodobacter sp.]